MKSTEMKGLTRKQEAVILALLNGSTREDAAARIGINTVTIWRWEQLPHFAAAYRKARQRLVDDGLKGLQCLFEKAVRALGRNLRALNASDRNRAAGLVLEHLGRFTASQDIEDRLTALENHIAKNGKR